MDKISAVFEAFILTNPGFSFNQDLGSIAHDQTCFISLYAKNPVLDMENILKKCSNFTWNTLTTNQWFDLSVFRLKFFHATSINKLQR